VFEIECGSFIMITQWSVSLSDNLLGTQWSFVVFLVIDASFRERPRINNVILVLLPVKKKLSL
jgi:cyanophycinase-like exopeptidase